LECSTPHSLEVLANALQRRHPRIEPRKLLLDGSDDPLLFCAWRDYKLCALKVVRHLQVADIGSCSLVLVGITQHIKMVELIPRESRIQMVGQNQPATEIRANEWKIGQLHGLLIDQYGPSHGLGWTTARNLKNDVSDLQSSRCQSRIWDEPWWSDLSTGFGPISKLRCPNHSNAGRFLRFGC
jgi:hypothetical protein